MKYLLDHILFRRQHCKWFWRFGFGHKMLNMKGTYAVQFIRSTAFKVRGYSSSGDIISFVDHIFLTKEFAEKVYEECTKKWQPADKTRGMIHDDILILWEHGKILRNYQEEVKKKIK